MKQCCENKDWYAVFAYFMFFVITSGWVVYHIPYTNIVIILLILICFISDIMLTCFDIKYKESKSNRSSWQITISAGFLYMLFMAYYGQFIWGSIFCISYIMRANNMRKFWNRQDKLFNEGKELECL